MYSLTLFRSLLLFFLSGISLALQAQYRLAGFRPNGTLVVANDIFLLNDSCTLYVQDSQGDTVRFRSCEWNYEVLFSDMEYRSKKSQLDVHRFGFKVEESLKEYSQSLHRVVDHEKKSVYFSIKFRLKGTTEAGANIRLEIPIYLNVLPAIPSPLFLSLIDIGTYDSEYDYYYGGSILLRFNPERTERYLVQGLPLEGIYPYLFYLDFSKGQTDIEFNFFDYDATNSFAGVNQFGAVDSAIEYNFKDDILRSLSIDAITQSFQFKLHPNPVKNILFIDGKTEQIKQIQIINSQGQILNSFGEGVSSIDVSSYSKGFYFVKIGVEGEKDEIHKILKE